MPIFGVILLRIFPHSDGIHISPHSFKMRGKCGTRITPYGQFSRSVSHLQNCKYSINLTSSYICHLDRYKKRQNQEQNSVELRMQFHFFYSFNNSSWSAKVSKVLGKSNQDAQTWPFWSDTLFKFTWIFSCNFRVSKTIKILTYFRSMLHFHTSWKRLKTTLKLSINLTEDMEKNNWFELC